MDCTLAREKIMDNPSGSDSVIARSDLIACESNGDRRDISVCIFEVEDDPLSGSGDMRCRVANSGFDGAVLLLWMPILCRLWDWHLPLCAGSLIC